MQMNGNDPHGVLQKDLRYHEHMFVNIDHLNPLKKNYIYYLTIIPIILALTMLVSCTHLHSKDQAQQEHIQRENQIIKPEQINNDVSRVFVESLLVGKGLDRKEIHEMLYDPRVVIDTGVIIKNLFDSEPKSSIPQSKYLDYSPNYILKGRVFIEDNKELFKSIRERYGVSPEIITAILIIESSLGTYKEKYKAFQVYFNLSLASNPNVLAVLRDTQGKSYPGLYEKDIMEKAQAKGKWALEELYALILLSDRLKMDPLEMKSSFAGALGPAQFIPTSFIEYGVAGTSNGRIDPFCMDDAIASAANYLKKAGWTETAVIGADQRRENAIRIYNHHKIYVDTVMKIYNELKISRANP